LSLLLAGAWLALVPHRAQAQVRDLDSYSPDRLQADLEAEFYPILFDGTQEADDEEVSLDDLRDAINHCFSLDANDDAGGPAGEIDKADLEAEMEEDNTTVAAVIEEAFEEADELSVRTSSPSWTVVRIGFPLDAAVPGPAPDGKAKRKVTYTSLVGKFECHSSKSCQQ
jgi:hypothetical protein